MAAPSCWPSASSRANRRRALAEDVRVEADRLYRLVEDLVILVNSERDGIRPVGEPVAIVRLVSAAIEREVARHPGVKIALLGASDAAADGADEEMVDHVIRNLLDNAIRYGGTEGPIEVIVEVTASEVTVRVNDHGAAPEPEGLGGPAVRAVGHAAGDGGGASRGWDRALRRGPPRAGDGRADLGRPRRLGMAPSSGSPSPGRRGRAPPRA